MNSGLQVYNEQAKLAQWAQVVAQCRESGMSVVSVNPMTSPPVDNKMEKLSRGGCMTYLTMEQVRRMVGEMASDS